MIRLFEEEGDYDNYHTLQLMTEGESKFFSIKFDNAWRGDRASNRTTTNIELEMGTETVAELDRSNSRVRLYQRGLGGKAGRMRMNISEEDMEKAVELIKENYSI
jgi:hypothetical protein